MSFLDTAERPDYEGDDTTISYTLSFNHGDNEVLLYVSHPESDSELVFSLTDPALIATLHAAGEAAADDHFRTEAEREEWEHLQGPVECLEEGL